MNQQTTQESSTYLTFVLGEETFGLEVRKVREVLDVASVTHIPRMPEYMRGVINLRGRVVPVLDLRSRFGLPEAERSDDSCIIVVEVDLDLEEEAVVCGVLADSVKAVLDMKSDDIEPPPRIGTGIDTSYIRGIGKNDDDFVIIMDVNRVFTAGEIDLVAAEPA